MIDRDELRLDRHYRFAERMAAGATTHWEWVHWASERDAREQELRAFGGARQELADGTTAG